jgi:hypothetical protein
MFIGSEKKELKIVPIPGIKILTMNKIKPHGAGTLTIASEHCRISSSFILDQYYN